MGAHRRKPSQTRRRGGVLTQQPCGYVRCNPSCFNMRFRSCRRIPAVSCRRDLAARCRIGSAILRLTLRCLRPTLRPAQGLCLYEDEFVLSTLMAMEEPVQFKIQGHDLKCHHCGHNRFRSRTILLNTRGLTFLELDWLNADAQVFVCGRCGFLTWFASEAEPQREDDVTEETVCLSCRSPIPAGKTRCEKCGWSYTE